MIDKPDLIDAAGTVVAAYVSNHQVSPGDLVALIDTVAEALSVAASPKVGRPTGPVLRVPIRKTITPDAIISLEDGRAYKTLGWHLKGRGLTPESYREKWGLPSDYPMVAANYAAARSALAKSMGLGRKPALTAPEAVPPKRSRARKSGAKS